MGSFRQRHKFYVDFNYESFKSKPKIVDLSFVSSFDSASTFKNDNNLTNIGD